MAGVYRVVATPVFPYAVTTIDTVEIGPDRSAEVSLAFTQPPVILVDRDTDSTNHCYYEEALANCNVRHYRWRSALEGSIAGRLEGFQTVIYFTGDRSEHTVPEPDRNALAEHLENGGGLFITGQDIADDLTDTGFLEDVLRCRNAIDDINGSLVEGVENDPVLGGMQMLLIGNRGANNQDSPAGVMPRPGATACATYRNHPDTAAAVRWETPGGGRGMFFAFGFEGISGQFGNSRREVMEEVLEWLGTPRSIDAKPSRAKPPCTLRIASVYPNPANGALRISFDGLLTLPGRLAVRDISGRTVAVWDVLPRYDGVVWNGTDISGRMVSSGCYFVVLFNPINGSVYDASRLIMIR